MQPQDHRINLYAIKGSADLQVHNRFEANIFISSRESNLLLVYYPKRPRIDPLLHQVFVFVSHELGDDLPDISADEFLLLQPKYQPAVLSQICNYSHVIRL